MRYENDCGFTIVELLVGISLGFIAISIVISAYLMISHAMIKYEKDISRNTRIVDYLLNIKTLLEKADSFEISFPSDSIHITTSNGKNIILWNKGMMINNDVELIEDGEIRLNIKTCNNEEYYVSHGLGYTDRITYANENISNINSSLITSIVIEINADNNKYSAVYLSPEISDKIFVNIKYP